MYWGIEAYVIIYQNKNILKYQRIGIEDLLFVYKIR